MKSSSLQLQIEKRTRSVFQLDEVYKACCFKPHLKRKLVAETSKGLVFLLPQRKIRCATTSLIGVGGSGRRHLEFWEKSVGAHVRATGVGFLCIGARDPGIQAILEAFEGSRDSQEAPGTLQRAPDGFPDAIRGSEKPV